MDSTARETPAENPFKVRLKKEGLRGFSAPTALPSTESDARRWQEANRSWWESHPMSYSWKSPIPFPEFSKEFYLEIDRRFLSQSREYLPWKRVPFDPLIPFDSLHDKEVLEIGVGNGTHADLLCRHARSFTGIDLTEYAVRSTANRMKIFGLKADILRMDAEALAFPDSHFDFVWSWGVIHHSSNPRRILKEIGRVLKPGGVSTLMVYHRGPWNYYTVGGLFLGLLHGDLFRTRSLHQTVQSSSDGALARYYSPSEWRALLCEFFKVKEIRVLGTKMDLLPIPAGAFKEKACRWLPAAAARFMTNTCGMGSFLVSTVQKQFP